MGFNFGFFGTQEQRVFNYKPRYYDPEKEALKEKFGHVDGRKEKEPYVQAIIGFVGLVLFFVVLLYVARFYSLL